ncbi:MAG: hypothetical protein GF317_18265 [Candidatus Lokiarchaeota archaeon]|nr:hypothetical protein [Candidatus Lokiarchaeota archaeon]MBD3201459.1 hypothetical protein [Candidatus Lokiarchaeota archaeon]
MELKKKKGEYSGNRRLNVDDREEHIHDDAHEREKWLSEDSKIRIKRKLKRWKNNISPTINPEELRVHMVGQSHIDCAWMWRYEQTRKKAQVTFRKAIYHSELFPDSFCFALSQPKLLEWVKEDNPELFREIQEKVINENIELVGGSYVEPDCMMPSGESMIRQRLYGMRFYFKQFKKLPEVEWFLDSFGYNYGLPQILTKSGAKYLWTSKLTWNRETTFPFVNFWWKGPDGSKILATNFHYDPQVLETWEQYEIGRHLLKQKSRKEWNYNIDYGELKEHVSQDQVCPEVGYFFGQSDGGHGPTHKEVAYANEQSKLKWFFWSKAESFFKALEKYSNSFPIWNDELYLEFHRGCFSNHARVKRRNRKYESLLSTIESLTSIISALYSDFQYPREKLEMLWKTTLKNQFHDVLPGSSIPEVYDDVWNDWKFQDEEIFLIKKDLKNYFSLIDKNTNQNATYLLLFNPLSWDRKSPIFIPSNLLNTNKDYSRDRKPPYAKITLLDGSNREFICQPIRSEPEYLKERRPSGWWTVIPLKSLGFTLVEFKLLKSNTVPELNETIEITEDYLSNNIVSLGLDAETGALLSLFANNIKNVKNFLKGNKSNLTSPFLDEGSSQYHAWNLTPKYWEHPIEFSNHENVRIKIIERGPIYSKLKITWKLGKDPISQEISLFKDYPLVYFNYFSKWTQKNVMLKIGYKPNFNVEKVVADGAFCVVKSKITPKTPCDKARFEKICHKFFDLSTSDNKCGLALINEGKYAFDVLDGNMRLTLLRACKYPDPAPEAWINKERKINQQKFNHKVPEYSGLGPFQCRYALFPHKGGTLLDEDGNPNVEIIRKSYEFNFPVVIIPGISETKVKQLKDLKSLLNISPPNVILSAFKLNDWDQDNSLILRFYESCGIDSEVKVSFNKLFFKKIDLVNPTDLLEREINDSIEINKRRGILKFSLSRHEIKTFKLELRL